MLSSCLLCLVHLWSCNFISSCCGTALKHDTKWKWNRHLASQNCHTKISINNHHVNLPESRLIWNIQHCLCSTMYGQSFAHFFTCKTISPALPLSKFQLQQIIMDSPPLISQISRETMIMLCYLTHMMIIYIYHWLSLGVIIRRMNIMNNYCLVYLSGIWNDTQGGNRR